jgi:hypothetical protein
VIVRTIRAGEHILERVPPPIREDDADAAIPEEAVGRQQHIDRLLP